MFKLSAPGRRSNLLLEILMIVVGINVALWFEGWFQDLQDRETEARYLVDLRADLVTDIDNLDRLTPFVEACPGSGAEEARSGVSLFDARPCLPSSDRAGARDRGSARPAD